MEYPIIPMLSGVAEMVLRIGTIVIFSSIMGFTATAYAETTAWSGALLMNMFAFFFYLSREMKQDEK